jgi:two-component system, OmpR family, phosphate regulon sensor histidine kinase PhoR
MSSLARRIVGLVIATVAPLVIAVWLDRNRPQAGIVALAWALAGIGAMWAACRSLSGRIREITAFANTLPDLRSPRPHLQPGDDEVGDLARALTRATPRLEELLNGLQTELARREAILASMTEGVLAVDSKLHVSFYNDFFARTVANGISEGLPLIKVLRDPALFELLESVVDSGGAVRQRISMSVGEERTFEVYATPLANQWNRGALAILHDITPLERLERIKRDFVANVSHEFRTPLATITGYAETLLDGGLEDEHNRRKFVEVIQANSVRLNNLAADLITLSQLEAGWPDVQPAPISIVQVIHNAMSTLEPVARLNGIGLRLEKVDDVEVLGHRIHFEQALVNLVDNAIKFNKPQGEVTVKAVRSGGDHVEISVSDTGIGIPRQDQSRIFERFYRVDKARSRQVGGTGLGLSIVRHAIEQMQGNVRVASEIGKGSCFTITLPLYGTVNAHTVVPV